MMISHKSMADLADLDAATAAERALTMRHLADCDSCRRRLAATREVRAAVSRQTAVEPPADLFQRILDRRAAGDRVILPIEPIQPPGPRIRGAWGAAMAAVALVGVVLAAPRVRALFQPAPIEPTVESPANPVAGVSIVPTLDPTDVRILDAASPVEVQVDLHDGVELGLSGTGPAANAVFRVAGNGLTVTGVHGGLVEVRIPRGRLATRVFLNDRLTVTSDGTILRHAVTGDTGVRLLISGKAP